MKLLLLMFGVALQMVALYVAFYSDMDGNIYLATLISVAAMSCIMVIRSLIAPVCLLSGILVGLSLSHNDSDLVVLSSLEKQAMNALSIEAKQDSQPSSQPFAQEAFFTPESE